MKLYGIAAGLAIALSAGLAAQAPVVPQAAGDSADRQVTLTGCVVKGDKGYVLADASEQIVNGGSRMAPDPFHSRTLYWLDEDGELKEHVGNRVEVTGKTKGKLEKGEVEVERKDEGTQLEFKANGEKVKVIVPDSDAVAGTSGSVPNKGNDYNIVVLNIDVKSVKKIADTCR